MNQRTSRSCKILPVAHISVWYLLRLFPVFIFTVCAISPAHAISEADQDLLAVPDRILLKLKREEIYQEDVPNPHWELNSCSACHTGNAGFNRKDLRTHNIDKLCGNCHNEYTKAAFIHPTGYEISDEFWSEIPSVFRESLGRVVGNLSHKVTCLSCHDLTLQCRKSTFDQKSINPLFFRLGPYRDRVELCFYCHDAARYERFNPHKQVVNGELDKKSCEVCHLSTKSLTPKTKRNKVRLRSSDDLKKLCINCHPWRPHPGWDVNVNRKKKSANHLVKPKKSMRQQMLQMATNKGVELPIGQKSGKINCATCHNPHQKGAVTPSSRNAGADSKHRLRIKKSCIYCHDV